MFPCSVLAEINCVFTIVYRGAQVAYVKPRLIIDELDECQPSIQEMDANLDMVSLVDWIVRLA